MGVKLVTLYLSKQSRWSLVVESICDEYVCIINMIVIFDGDDIHATICAYLFVRVFCSGSGCIVDSGGDV